MILVLNGPNLNLLGQREPGIYGSTTLGQLEDLCGTWAADLGMDVSCRQTNHEGVLIDWLHAAEEGGFTGVILNAGGLSHTSVALLDAIKSIRLPVVEDMIEGREISPKLLDDVTVLLNDILMPNTDLHASASYRRQLSGTLARRALSDAWHRASSAEMDV